MARAGDWTVTGRDALHARIAPLGAGLLMAACVTDIFYVRTFSTQWETFSIWLITGGLIFAGIAGLALIVDLLWARGARQISWLKLTAFVLAVVLSVFNAFVHSRDGFTAVSPSGIELSACVALLLVVIGCFGWSVLRPAVRTVVA